MKKMIRSSITHPERNERRALRLTQETVRLLRPEALAQAMSGCDTTSWTTDAPVASKAC
ncbi:MAG TPA: hypothetical protein VF516_43745 [Kofleriaceae bacterium]